jgi:hypothetical protein
MSVKIRNNSILNFYSYNFQKRWFINFIKRGIFCTKELLQLPQFRRCTTKKINLNLTESALNALSAENKKRHHQQLKENKIRN